MDLLGEFLVIERFQIEIIGCLSDMRALRFC